MVVAMLLTLATGLAIELAFWGSNGRYTISDLPRVFLHRGVGPGAFPYIDRVIEYPVAAGLMLYAATLIAPSAIGILLVTAAGAGALCVAITLRFERRFGGRAWRWALATPLALFAFQNWDVFAIAAMLVGLAAFERHRNTASGAALGLGAAIKLFPAVLIPPLVAMRWAQGDRRGARQLAASGAAVFAAFNLPVMIASPHGWLWTFAFQSQRHATWGTLWYWVYRSFGLNSVSLANMASLLVTVVGIGAVTVYATRARIQPAAIAAIAVVIFVLSNKVYSPTYDLWVVPFFVLLPIERRLWLGFCAVDFAIFVNVYGHFHGLQSHGVALAVMPFLVVTRAVILVKLAMASTHLRDAETVPIGPASPDLQIADAART